MRLFLGALATVFAAALTLAGLAAWASINFTFLDIVTNLAPLAFDAVIFLAACLYWADIPFRRVGAIAALTGILVWGGLTTPEYARALFQPKVRPDAEMLKIVQFNLWAADTKSSRKIDWLLAQDADVLVLEELSSNSDTLIGALRPRYPYMINCTRPPSPCSVALLSRQPPVGQGYYNQGPQIAWGQFVGPGGAYVVAATHLSRSVSRGSQLLTLTKLMKTLGPENSVLAGDFNTTPWSFTLRRFDKASGLVRRTRALPTWPTPAATFHRIPAPMAIFPIDQIYAGRGWKTVSVRKGPNLSSDHYPVVVVLTRP